MWMGSPELTSSVASSRRKSCGANVTPSNSGWIFASWVQQASRRRRIVVASGRIRLMS
jgi:hypothetical protein